MSKQILVVKQEGVPLDLLMFRELRREVRLEVETTLMNSFNLAEKGIFLPLGTKVEVEIIDVPVNSVPVVRVLRLWG